MKLIYHLTMVEAWESAQRAGEVVADSLATEGFIHCSRQTQLLAVANRFFPGVNGLLVLAIDESGVAPWLVNEGPLGVGDPFTDNVFPHVYGPIPIAAVVQVVELKAGPAGLFEWHVGLGRV